VSVSQLKAITIVSAVVLLAIATRPPISRAGDCSGQAQITGENLKSVFPDMPAALQDQPTGFGNASPPVEADTQGNELNRLFIANDATHLYIGITGNTQLTDTLENTFLVFIDTPAMTGSDVLATQGMTGSSALIALDPPDPAMPDPPVPGVKLDFSPEFALAVWNVGGVQTALLHDLTDPMDDPAMSGGVLTEGMDYAVDNSNQAGVNESFAADPVGQTVNAATATTGVEFKIPLASLGLTNSDTINLQVLLVGGGGFISNQSLPPIDNVDGGEPCIGNHDPLNADPMAVNDVDFTNNIRFPGTQNVSHTLNPAGMAPAMSPDGTHIPMRYDPDNNPMTQDGVGKILATQNNFTCFNDAQPFTPIPSGGAEIDQIFVRADFNKLYIGITGNLPFGGGNDDTILVFIDNPQNFDGTSELFTNDLPGGSGALQGLSNGAFGGFKFDADFEPEVAIQYWRGGSQPQAVISSVVFDDPPIELEFSSSSARHLALGVSAFSDDVSNLLGVNNITGDDPINQEAFAATAKTGVVFSVSLTDVGLQGAAGDGMLDVKIAVGIVSGSGFVSNQWLPPLNPTVMPSMTDMANFSDAPLPLAIPDNDATSAEDTRTVDMSPAIDRVTDIDVSVAITHADAGELEITLLHVDSDRLVKLAAPGDLMGANPSVTFDSQEVVGVLPNESLLTFNDVDPNGDWTIIVTDSTTGNVGTLDSWGISVEEFEGGGRGCLEQFDAVDNPIDLGDDMVFPGKQYFDLTGANAIVSLPGNVPSDFSASFDDGGTPEDPMDDDPPGIPAAFGGTPVTVTGPNAVSSTQNNYTCFGNATESTPSNLPGSELNQVLVTNTSSRLKVALTGNLENNGNAVVLLLDTTEGAEAPAGLATIAGITSPPNAIGGAGGGQPGFNGLMLDAGFTPNYAMVVQHDPTAGVPFDDYNVFLTRLSDNFTRTIGRFTRNSNSGFLLDGIPNQNGSELNRLYVQNDADHLFIGITGNLEANGNSWIIFLQTTVTGSGTNTLDTDQTGWPGALMGINCDVLETGMQPNFAVVYQRGGGNPTANLVDLLDLAPGVTVTPLTLQSMAGDNAFAVDNSNAVGVSGDPADDIAAGMTPPATVQEENAATAIRGVQIAIDRDSLGHTEPMMIAPPDDGDPIRICAIVVSPDGFWSNQTLPGLGGEIENLGNPPGGCPANFVDLSNAGVAPGQQYAEFNLAMPAEYGTPLNFDGSDIPASMDPDTRNGILLATQDNFTAFGNAVLLNPGNDNCTQVALNNDNILGVGGYSAMAPVATPAEADSAFDGMEFDIDFADVGLTPLDPMTGPFVDVRLMAVVTGQFGFFSNQFLPPLMRDPPSDNLMDIGNWTGDLSDVLIAPGNQYLSYTLVPGCGDDPVDINADGMVTCADLTAFVEVLLGNNVIECDVQKANVNRSSPAGVNGLDMTTFIELFIANGGCVP
jgi:subtilisin-like proprotein convertase family protein